MPRRAVALIFACASAVCVLASSGGSLGSVASTSAIPLTVLAAQTPPLRVPRYDTSGSYPQVRGRVDLRAVNAALGADLRADQRGYAREALKERARQPSTDRGVYRTEINRRYLSASSVVVSALLSVTRELFPGQHGGDGWLGMTVQVPSGQRVAISDLFTNPDRGIRALAAAWQARVRRTDARPCLRIYAEAYTPTAAHYQAFALTTHGIAVGSQEVEACYRLVETVPYATLRPYLSKLGSTLISGVRQSE